MRLQSSAIIMIAAAVMLLLIRSDAWAQRANWTNPGTGDWDTPANWDTFPDAPPLAAFGEFGVISNGGTAFIDGPGASGNTGGIILGDGGGETGFLELRSGGSIVVESNLGTSGAVDVGNSGTGNLTVFRGGTLTTTDLTSGGASGSQIILGEIGGAGTATLTVQGSSSLNRTTRVTGPNVAYTTVGLGLGTQSLLIAEVTGNAHSTISATGDATLNGTLQVDFNGYAPQMGDFWDVIDAGSLNGDFSTVQLAPGDSLGNGLGLIVNKQAGGVNGNLARVSVASKLVLTVNRNDGSVSMGNLAGGNIDFDGYSISSPGGHLDDGAWASLQSQAVPGWLEIGTPSPNLLAELNPNDSTVVSGGQSFDLGQAFGFTPSTFGESGDDLVFEYSLESGGVVDGIVQYEGNVNNLVFRVDAATGEGGLQNQSPFAVAIDGYEIRSPDGSLQPDDGDWLSLADNPDFSGWLEIGSPTPNLLAELMPTGSMEIASGQFISLGVPFAAGGAEDLEFAFSIFGDVIMDGVVQYGSVPALICDFDGGGCGLSDIDLLVMEIAAGGNNLDFDVNGDNVIDDQDLTDWLLAAGEANLGPGRSYIVGDANLDSVVDGPDFLVWNTNKFMPIAAWSAGDFTADGVVDGRDFLEWNTNKFTSADAVQSVPEPSSLAWLLCAAMLRGLSSLSRSEERGARSEERGARRYRPEHERRPCALALATFAARPRQPPAPHETASNAQRTSAYWRRWSRQMQVAASAVEVSPCVAANAPCLRQQGRRAQSTSDRQRTL